MSTGHERTVMIAAREHMESEGTFLPILDRPEINCRLVMISGSNPWEGVSIVAVPSGMDVATIAGLMEWPGEVGLRPAWATRPFYDFVELYPTIRNGQTLAFVREEKNAQF